MKCAPTGAGSFGEIDEAAWASLYANQRYPFDAPETGKIAVTVINHYGVEVPKVYEVR